MSAASEKSTGGSGHWGDLSSDQEQALQEFMRLTQDDHAQVREKRRLAQSKRDSTPGWDKDLPEWIDRPLKLTEEEEQQEFLYEALRFLRSRKFDVQKSVDKYRGYLAFFDKHDGYRILDSLPAKYDALRRVVPHSFSGVDRSGRPSYNELDGIVNVNACLYSFTEDEIEHLHVWGQELLVRRTMYNSRKYKKNVETFVNILDVTGLKLDHRRCLKYVQRVLSVDEANYPERLGRLYVVNAPWVFPVLWNIVKFWLDPVTKSKIVVVKGKPSDTLLKEFDADELPQVYGGTRPNIVVPDISDILAKVQDAESSMEFETVKVAAGKKCVQTVSGPANATYAWYLKTAKHDIALEVEFVGDDGSKETVVEKARVNGSEVAIQGSWTSSKAGKVNFIFDNSFSWLKGKTVKYVLSVADDMNTVGTEEHHASAEIVAASPDTRDDAADE